jgi:hypothetical protein
MALTEEQIKNLKRGDILILNNYPVSYTDTVRDGIIRVLDDNADECCMTACYFPEKYLSMPPKYDPCRLLRKGDRVQVKKRNGRCNGKAGEYLREAFCEVAEDEVPNGLVRFFHNSSEYRLDPAYLELVTPVEELGPYSVRHNEAHAAWSIYGPYNLSAVNYFYGERYPYTEESAKAAAEAERDRLNAEWRKEQK